MFGWIVVIICCIGFSVALYKLTRLFLEIRLDKIQMELDTAIYVNNLKAVKKYHKKGGILTSGIINDNLELAIRKGYYDIVKYIIENTKINFFRRYDLLSYAIGCAEYDIANYLRNAAGDKWKCHECLIRPSCTRTCDDYVIIPCDSKDLI